VEPDAPGEPGEGNPGERRSRRPSDRLLAAAQPLIQGRLSRIGQAEAEVVGLELGPGDLVRIGDAAIRRRPAPTDSGAPVLAEVVSAEGTRATVLPFGVLRGHRVGAPVQTLGGEMEVAVGPQLLGRVLNGLGQAIDAGPPLSRREAVPIRNTPPDPLSRPPVTEAMPVGIRAIDTLLTCGRGQRVAIMAGSGVGKSSLLSMLVRGSGAEVNVLCLVGERGREVREFLESDLGPEGLARSVVVVATSDQTALVRRNAAYVATRVAEDFRDRGHHVNLLMDSVTRFAIAQREIGLAAGEIPSARGFPPSAFGLLPGLLERAGTSSTGSITGFYTVLVEGDDVNDPIGDTVRSIVDGHLVLSRELANAGHFPSIDVLASASRVALSVTSAEQRTLAAEARRLLSIHDRARDLIEVGAYSPGSDPELDRAVALAPALEAFRRQDLHDLHPADQAWADLAAIVLSTGGPFAPPGPGTAGAGAGFAAGAPTATPSGFSTGVGSAPGNPGAPGAGAVADGVGVAS
jgi:flagellum-specific ATP synthase